MLRVQLCSEMGLQVKIRVKVCVFKKGAVAVLTENILRRGRGRKADR